MNKLNQKAFFNINILIVISLVLMVSFWLVTTPKVDILQNLADLPKLTVQKITQPENEQQDSNLTKKPVIDSKAASKLSTKSINDKNDLTKINKDLDSTNIDSLNNPINQLDVAIE